MKKYLIAFSFLLSSIYAQSQDQKKQTSIYMLGGPSYLNIRGMTYNNNFVQKGKDKLGYFVGLGGTHRFGFLNRHLLLSMRLLWERRQFQVNYVAYNQTGALVGESDQDFSKYYITACFIPQVIIGKHFNIGIGYYFSQLTRQTVVIRTYNNLLTFGSSLNQASQIDHGVSLTAGYSLPAKNYLFTVQLSSNYGTKNAFAISGDTRYYTTYSLLFGVGYKINQKQWFGH